MHHSGCRCFHQTLDVAGYVLQGHLSDLTLALQMRGNFFAPFGARDLRNVAFIAQKIIDDQHARGVDSRSEQNTTELQSMINLLCQPLVISNVQSAKAMVCAETVCPSRLGS